MQSNTFSKLSISSHSKGRFFAEKKSTLRSSYQRDRDRIIHSTAFRRLKHKTQVFVNTLGDHFRTRITHSLEVSQIARTLSKVFGLNEDLSETLSLAHDLGHTPFGHAGEEALNECMKKKGGFDHNIQTLRIVTLLENKYYNFKGLNLTVETLDGLIKHNGPIRDKKKINEILGVNFFKNKINFTNSPSLEAQIASISDDIAYNSHDLEDGLNSKLFTLNDISKIPVLKTLKKWKGKLIEPKYTKNISSTLIKQNILKVGTSPDKRKSKLKRIMEAKEVVRVLESHSALTGLIIENLKVIKKQKYLEFDGMWSSSLTDSALRGKPDNQSVDYSTRILGLNEILDVTTKPIIFDADNGGRLEHLPYMIKSLERIGVSAVIIEDKVGLKKNSLFKNQTGAKQDSIKSFCKKISKAKNTKISDDFMIIARIESFILGKGVNDALKRAEAYSNAGADAILIHSKENNPSQIFSFSKKFKKSKYFKPLVSVPSSYSKTYEKDLIKNGFKIIIYANHMMRASYPSMLEVAKSILNNGRSYDMEKKISSIKEIINLIK